MSLNNTPIGLSNGLMLHAWLLTAFFLSRSTARRPVAADGRPMRRVAPSAAGVG